MVVTNENVYEPTFASNIFLNCRRKNQIAPSAAFTRRLAASSSAFRFPLLVRQLRSDATLEAIRKASQNKIPNLVLYNYPSFSGAFGALFAHLYHSRLNLPCFILPFSSVAPFRVIGFDHRKSVLSQISSGEDSDPNISFHVNIEKSSSTTVYEYFSAKLSDTISDQIDNISLLNHDDQERMEMILKYVEAGDLRQWNLPNIKAFYIGLREFRSKLNCITNPLMYQQLTEICSEGFIIKGNTYLSNRPTEASKLLNKVFRIKFGRGFYGECLAIRADGNSDFSDEMGKELSQMSAAAGLRPIGAVLYMQRNNLKMSLRTIDSGTDTSEIALAYGGGGFPSSSSFIIRMDEYNQWRSALPLPIR
ncbi:uncharacterized protein LOC121754845 [Salvia splendens]|uniref:uncharacterized protein LOC121754845 n=1 Tax=Salvia splendens TaxID=180675 RepID=UPI001C270D9F|nr:uncharacterized protein LOC121754845 [Salvia splendens]